jgi:CheY-like chemotaxis protein
MTRDAAFLYVEDDPLSREIMQVMLHNLGYTKLTIFEDSTNFEEQLDNLGFQPTQIFLDIHLKPLDGFEMLRILRRRPDFANTVVIAITASVMNEEVAQLKDAGFDGAIGKPLDFENFAMLIERVLNGEQVWYVI